MMNKPHTVGTTHAGRKVICELRDGRWRVSLYEPNGRHLSAQCEPHERGDVAAAVANEGYMPGDAVDKVRADNRRKAAAERATT